MSARDPVSIDAVAAVIEDVLMDLEVNCMSYCLGGSIPVREGTEKLVRALTLAGWLRTAEDRADDQNVLDAAEVWLLSRERCNDPFFRVGYAQAVDDLAHLVALRRARRVAAGGTEAES